ncbi:MAG: Nif3-like dinuclear metal center hexameric protein [Clostridia bacterium]|nr:Nif3-like dinuclear metal center hexameric protein [Clostridia bacterium]
MYDTSVIIIDSGNDINGALFSLDLSTNAVKEAKARGYNLIVTHHPAIYGGISRICANDAVAQCVKEGISVISMHLNFDAAPEGIDYHLMKGLGGDKAEILSPVTGGGYGRAYEIYSIAFSEYVEKIKSTFSSQRVLAYGEEKSIKKVASFCGAGYDDNAMNFAVAQKVDLFVSSDLKHHEITALLTRGLNVIHLTHYSAENYGFNKIYLKIREELKVPSAYFCDGTLL